MGMGDRGDNRGSNVDRNKLWDSPLQVTGEGEVGGGHGKKEDSSW